MNKNLRIPLFLDVKQYTDIVETAKTRGISYKNDSEMLRKMLFDYTDKIESLLVAKIRYDDVVKKLREGNEKKQSVIDEYQKQVRDLSNELEGLKLNIKKRKGGKK